MVPKLSPNGPKVPKIIPKRSQNSPELVPKRPSMTPEMVPKWSAACSLCDFSTSTLFLRQRRFFPLGCDFFYKKGKIWRFFSGKKYKMGFSEMYFPDTKWKIRRKSVREKLLRRGVFPHWIFQTPQENCVCVLESALIKRLLESKPAIFDKKWHFHKTKLH